MSKDNLMGLISVGSLLGVGGFIMIFLALLLERHLQNLG